MTPGDRPSRPTSPGAESGEGTSRERATPGAGRGSSAGRSGQGASHEPPRPSGSPIPELPGIMADDWRPPPGTKPIYDGLRVMLGGVTTAFATMGDVYCATILQERGELLARAWTNLSHRDPRVKAFFTRLVQGGAWSETIFVTVSVVLPMLQHHVPPLQRVGLPFGLSTTPADHDGGGAAQAARAAAEAAFGMGQDGQGPVETPSATDVAEQQRREAEARRAATPPPPPPDAKPESEAGKQSAAELAEQQRRDAEARRQRGSG